MRIGLIATLCLASGCSLTMRTAPSRPDPRVQPACSISNARPAADVIAAPIAFAAGIGIGLAVGSRDGDREGGSLDARYAAAGVGAALALGAVGAWGIGEVRSCRRASRAHARWRAMGRPDLATFRAAERSRAKKRGRERCRAWNAALARARTAVEAARAARERPAGC